jgi:hypothetical protein
LHLSFVNLEELSSKRLRVFSVIKDNNELTEFDIFYDKEFESNLHLIELDMLYEALGEMRYRGAKAFYFNPEEAANYMPVVTDEMKDENKDDFGVRLYCVRLRDDLLVLLNGDIKTTRNPRDCPNVRSHFKFALALAAKLDKDLMNKELDYNQANPFQDYHCEL